MATPTIDQSFDDFSGGDTITIGVTAGASANYLVVDSCLLFFNTGTYVSATWDGNAMDLLFSYNAGGNFDFSLRRWAFAITPETTANIVITKSGGAGHGFMATARTINNVNTLGTTIGTRSAINETITSNHTTPLALIIDTCFWRTSGTVAPDVGQTLDITTQNDGVQTFLRGGNKTGSGSPISTVWTPDAGAGLLAVHSTPFVGTIPPSVGSAAPYVNRYHRYSVGG